MIRCSILLLCLAHLAGGQTADWMRMTTDGQSGRDEVIAACQTWSDSLRLAGQGKLVSRLLAPERFEAIGELREEGEEHFYHWLRESADRYADDGRLLSLPAYKHKMSRLVGNSRSQSVQGNWHCLGPFSTRPTLNGIGGSGVGRVFPFDVSPADTNILFAGTPLGGLWRSTDDGRHWQALSDSVAWKTVTDVCAHPTRPGTWYVTLIDELFQTTDTGHTWTLLRETGNSTGHVLIDAAAPDRLYHSFEWPYMLFRSDDNGQSWITCDSVWAQQICPGQPDILYGIGQNTVFYRSQDGGMSFDSLNQITIPSSSYPYYITVTPADPMRVYVSTRSLSTVVVAYSHDQGSSFSVGGATGSGQANMVLPCIAVSESDPERLLAGGELTSRSVDGGLSWTFSSEYSYDSTNALPYVHPDTRCIRFRGNTVWVGTDGGIYKSEDGGFTFQDRTDGLSVGVLESLAISPVDSAIYLVGADDCNIIVHSDSAGWANTFGGDGLDVAIHPGDPLIYFGKNQYGFYRTLDGGHTYVTGSSNLFQGVNESQYGFSPGKKVRFNPLNPNTVFLAIDNVWKSTDLGTHAQAISSGLRAGGFLELSQVDSNTLFTRNHRTHDQGASWLPVNAHLIAIDPDEVNKLWGLVPAGLNFKVAFSEDTGNTWQQYPGLDISVHGLNRVMAGPANNAADGLYLLNEYEVYYIDDSLSNFQPIASGLPAVTGFDLQVVPGTDRIRMATKGRGVWEGQAFDRSLAQAPVADFVQDMSAICPGDSIRFQDNSLHAGLAYQTLYYWTFPGGQPASSMDVSPVVTYPNAGTYDVGLRITGLNGQDSVVRSSVVVEPPPVLAAPFNEGFESAVFPPPGWEWNIRRAFPGFSRLDYFGGAYEQSDWTLAYYTGGTPSIQPDRVDVFISPLIDLSLVPDPALVFDRVYGYDYDPAQADTLALFVTPDCGRTRQYFWERGGHDLMTDSISIFSFQYDSTSWVTDTFSLFPFQALGQYQIGLEVRSHLRCEQLFDNIRVVSIPGVGIQPPVSNGAGLVCWPNPAVDRVHVRWNGPAGERGILTVTDIAGKELDRRSLNANTTASITTEQLLPGCYLLILDGPAGRSVERFIRR